jgi:hypothetical protein
MRTASPRNWHTSASVAHAHLPLQNQAIPHGHHPRNDGVARRADSYSPSSSFMRHRVRRRWREWERIGTSGQVLSWIRHDVCVKFKHGSRSRPFNHGTSMLDATPAQLEFLNSELPRFEAYGAWERAYNPRYVSHVLLVPKHGHNQWYLIIDLCELNRYCFQLKMTCETLKHLRHLSHPGDYFVSLDLTDGYYTLGIRKEDYDYRGAVWRFACLPMGWSGSTYYLCKLTKVLTNYLRRPPPPTLATTDALPNLSTKRPLARYPPPPLYGRHSIFGRLLQRCYAPPPARISLARPTRPPAKPQERRLDAYTNRRPLGLNCQPHPRYVPRPARQAPQASKRPPYSAKQPPTHVGYPHANSRLSQAKPNSST